MELPAIIPRPAAIEAGNGFFSLTPKSVISTDAASRQTARQLAEFLRPATGFALKNASWLRRSGSTIELSQDKRLATLGSEGYELAVTPEKISLAAPTQAGLFYAVQTLRQLLPPGIFATNLAQGVAWKIPCVKIRDVPRFAWRGLLLDTGHDFQEFPFLLRFIDLMALHKFNTLHWHITDLGSWALEIKGYPKLQDPSTRGTRLMGEPKRGVKPGFYTQDQVRQVVRYAAERHITVVPEIDMPGHSTPALIAYPELDCPVPHRTWEWDRWEYCVSNEKAYKFLEDVLSQVMELFPSKFINIGGDECPSEHWAKCPSCRALMKAENMKDADELQNYFTKRIEAFLNARGRRAIGWEEILRGAASASTAGVSWHSMQGGIDGARTGHDVVMAPCGYLYFDYAETTTPLAKVYSFEPVPAKLTPEQAVHVLGAQGQLWSDNHPTEKEIERLVYPRACALAEVVWSPVTNKDYSSFVARLAVHERRLAALGINYSQQWKGRQ